MPFDSENPRQPRVLVVEDDRDAAQMLACRFLRRGYNTQIAYDAEEALRVAIDFQPDVAFIDIGLPRKDGLELARELGRHMSRRPFLVALTGYVTGLDRERAQQAGFNEYFTKPHSSRELCNVVMRSPFLVPIPRYRPRRSSWRRGPP